MTRVPSMIISRNDLSVIEGYLVSDDDDSQSSSSNLPSCRMKPMNFSTIATPHLSLIRYSTLFSSLTHRLGPKLEIQVPDDLSSDMMSDPDLPFYRSLTMFKRIRVFANAVNDLTVPYVTAAMEEEDPFVDWEEKGLKVEYQPRYRPLITSYNLSSSTAHKSKTRHSKPLIPLPPFLVKPFPFKTPSYPSLFLLPSLVFVRFTRATGRSRLRISQLEKRFADRQSLSLMQALSDLERQVERRIEDAVVDAIDDPVGDPIATNTNSPGTSTPFDRERMSPSPSPPPPPNKESSKNAPLLTPLQRTICARLNTLPGLKKEIAFIDDSLNPTSQSTKRSRKTKAVLIPIRNSHAPIVSRDVRNFEHHRIGEGVVLG
ncbi:hypothetical protein DFJ43DRAFT_1094831 [Lentinula guzmanii]|uniref:DUF676 domain-containing protein n=1 Tax=Lentinula guzmanii TaxID=2804957 RepID=A0AA38MWP2_9AGAR|nr:hypothetical protein DFJ43DRAFT_1094831 [Lentinula guzmanii]